MKLALCAWILVLAQNDETKFREAVDAFWKMWEPLGIFAKEGMAESMPDVLAPDEEKKFVEQYDKVLRAAAEALAKSGVDAATYRKALEGDAEASKAVLEKLGKSTGVLAGAASLAVVTADPAKSVDLLGAAGDDFVFVAAHFAKCLFGLIYTELRRDPPVRYVMDDALAQVLGRKVERIDYARAALRIVSDGVLLKTLHDPNARGFDGRKKQAADEKVWKVIQKQAQPDDGVTWMAFVRYHVSQADQNFMRIDDAIKADPGNGFYDYARAYFHFFKGEHDKARASLKAGNEKRSVNLYTRELMDAIVRAHDGPVRFYMGLYQLKNPHAIWMTDLARHYISQRMAEIKPEEALELADLAITAYERLLGAYTSSEEYAAFTFGLKTVLERKAELVKGKPAYWPVARRIAELEWNMMACTYALPITDELAVFAATTMLDDAGAEAFWQARKQAGLDRERIERAIQRLQEHVVGEVLAKNPSVGGSLDEDDYKAAKAALEAGKPAECHAACVSLLQKDPKHLNAVILKRKALEAIKE